jgi:hypothetical protein
MGDVIYVKFGAERAWEHSHHRLTDTLVAVGAMFGDNDEDLLRAKADCAHDMIRKIVEEVPAVDSTFEIPDNLPSEQCELIRETLKAAALKGIETAIRRAPSTTAPPAAVDPALPVRFALPPAGELQTRPGDSLRLLFGSRPPVNHFSLSEASKRARSHSTSIRESQA